MNQPHDDERWIDRARALLDESAENLDAATLSRLNRARQAALATRRKGVERLALGRGARRRGGRRCSRLRSGCIGRCDRPAMPAASLQAGDIDVLTSDDDALDLAENLDFYAWLGKQGAGGPSG